MRASAAASAVFSSALLAICLRSSFSISVMDDSATRVDACQRCTISSNADWMPCTAAHWLGADLVANSSRVERPWFTAEISVGVSDLAVAAAVAAADAAAALPAPPPAAAPPPDDAEGRRGADDDSDADDADNDGATRPFCAARRQRHHHEDWHARRHARQRRQTRPQQTATIIK
jgi:hypothetical protein